MNNERRVKQAAFRMSFLMSHQEVTDILELESMALMPVVDENSKPPEVNKESPEYLAGASDALVSLIQYLKQKGF